VGHGHLREQLMIQIHGDHSTLAWRFLTVLLGP